jgi:hypothetical protein
MFERSFRRSSSVAERCVYGMISDHGGLISGESERLYAWRFAYRPRQSWSDLKRNTRGGISVCCKSITEYDSFEIYTYQSNPL